MNETNEIEKFTPPEKEKFGIVSAKKEDSLGTERWKGYLNKEKLTEVWRPPEGSPYKRYYKSKTIDSINQWAEELKPRYSKGELNSERE